MKKSNKILVASLMTALMVVGCGSKNSSSTKPATSSKTDSSKVVSTPVTSSTVKDSVSTDKLISEVIWTGVEDRDVNQKKLIGVFNGVSIKGVSEGEEFVIPAIFVNVTCEGAEIKNNQIATDNLAVGTKLTLKYRISDDFLGYAFADESAREKTCVITIVEAATNLVTNGDFENEKTGWALNGEGNYGTFSVVDDGTGNHVGRVEITGESAASYEPRLNIDNAKAGFGMYFEVGKAYQLSFKVKSSVARPLYLQVGRFLADDPWFYQYASNVYNLTTEWQTLTKTFEFTGNGDGSGNDSNVHLCFELGTVNGEFALATVDFDDISVTEFTGVLPDETAPVFSGTDYTRVAIGAEFDLMDGVTAIDNKDGDITSRVQYTVRNAEGAEVEFTTNHPAGSDVKYKVTYTVSDNAGNIATVTRTIRVCDENAPEENFFADPTSVKEEGESYAKANPGTFVYWADQGWVNAIITVTKAEWDSEAKKFDLSYTSVGSNWFSMQLFYVSPDMSAELSYIYNFTLVSSVTDSITVNGQVFDIVPGENQISAKTAAGALLSIQFGVDATKTMCPGGDFSLQNIIARAA